MKYFLESKTVQIAIIQAVLGITVAILTEYDMVAYVAVVKSLVDVIVRSMTETKLGFKK